MHDNKSGTRIFSLKRKNKIKWHHHGMANTVYMLDIFTGKKIFSFIMVNNEL